MIEQPLKVIIEDSTGARRIVELPDPRVAFCRQFNAAMAGIAYARPDHPETAHTRYVVEQISESNGQPTGLCQDADSDAWVPCSKAQRFDNYHAAKELAAARGLVPGRTCEITAYAWSKLAGE